MLPALTSSVRIYQEGESYRVIVWDLFGKIVRDRTYRYGTNRMQWAVRQAREWEEKFYAHFDGTIAVL